MYIFAIHDIPSEIIAASIRHPMHVTEAAKNVYIATIPYKVLMQLFKHPLTNAAGLTNSWQIWENEMSNMYKFVWHLPS